MLRIAGGEHRGRKLRSVPGARTRPTAERVRQAVFDIAGPRRFERVLDAFAGTGAMALEALSRGASEAVAIDDDKLAADMIAANARNLGLEGRLSVVRDDALRALGRMACGPGFDLVFADPPYAYDRWAELLEALARVARPEAIVAVEHAADRPLPEVATLATVRVYRYGGTALAIFSTTP